MEQGEVHGNGISRRELLSRAGSLSAGALILSAIPIAERMARPSAALAGNPTLIDGTLQAFWDTMIPGRIVTQTQSGAGVHPQAILGEDPEPGAVEADALMLGNDPRLGFTLLSPALLAEIEVRSLLEGGLFLDLDWDSRQAVVLGGLDFSNPTRLVWEAGAAIAFTAFCAAGTVPEATDKTAVGYKVMGHPGTAPKGYKDFSYGKRLNRGRTQKGYLP